MGSYSSNGIVFRTQARAFRSAMMHDCELLLYSMYVEKNLRIFSLLKSEFVFLMHAHPGRVHIYQEFYGIST